VISIILRTATRYMMPLLLLFSFFLFFRGHNLPGGGFVGGLVAASAFILYTLAFDSARARRILPARPSVMVSAGLLLALASGLAALLEGAAFMTGEWIRFRAPVLGEVDLGTPLIFDAGVFLVVAGMALAVIFTLAEEE
jgi:multicomponent Na+:H+ antiporter subunit B